MAHGIEPTQWAMAQLVVIDGKVTLTAHTAKRLSRKAVYAVDVSPDGPDGRQISFGHHAYHPLQSNYGGFDIAKQADRIHASRDRDDRVRARASSKGKRRASKPVNVAV
jgi:acyl-coenzyme A thioesterase PaaI-like protein